MPSDSSPFDQFFFVLRSAGVPVGVTEWLTFLEALKAGVIGSADELYAIGRSILCRTEADYDAFDLAFATAFEEATLPEDLASKVAEWLEEAARRFDEDRARREETRTAEELWRDLLDTMREQTERHDGGNRWVGTGGTSPFGHSGYASRGIRVGGEGRNRSAISVAMERRWASHRTDEPYQVRNLQVALRALRDLGRDGALELDLDATIERTCRNAGDIEIVEHRARANRVHLVLLMDSGGSMAPHARRVSRLFDAAERLGTFKSMQAYAFHNCVYDVLWDESGDEGRVPTDRLIRDLGPRHRVLFVGDACMAPYELFSPHGWPPEEASTGLEMLERIQRACGASAWLNPEPRRYWNHPTIRAVQGVFEMHELTVDGIREAVQGLRTPRPPRGFS